MRIRMLPPLIVGSVILGKRCLFIAVVRGESMHPTFVDGDRLLVARALPGMLRPGQVVVARPSDAQIQLWRNGADYAFDVPGHLIKRLAAADGRLPLGTVYLRSDNLSRGIDSRALGPFNVEQIDGIVFRPRRRRGNGGVTGALKAE